MFRALGALRQGVLRCVCALGFLKIRDSGVTMRKTYRAPALFR
jgi:hypothetical protein